MAASRSAGVACNISQICIRSTPSGEKPTRSTQSEYPGSSALGAVAGSTPGSGGSGRATMARVYPQGVAMGDLAPVVPRGQPNSLATSTWQSLLLLNLEFAWHRLRGGIEIRGEKPFRRASVFGSTTEGVVCIGIRLLSICPASTISNACAVSIPTATGTNSSAANTPGSCRLSCGCAGPAIQSS